MQVSQLIDHLGIIEKPSLTEDQKTVIEAGTKMVEEILKNRRKPFIKVITPSRNDLCPCGSGKKYKKCCMDINSSILNNLDNG